MSCLLVASSIALATAFARPSLLPTHALHKHEPEMLFGGGDNKDGNGPGNLFKAAKDMFNPEMMKKYAEVGEKVQALQQELSQTEVECATNEGGIVVKVTATQMPISVEVSDDMCQKGGDFLSSELLTTLKQTRVKSGSYMQQKMAELYQEMGIAPGQG